MIFNIAIMRYFGLSLVAWNGILTLILFSCVAIVGWSKFHGKIPKLSFYWHPGLAIAAFLSAILHATLALSIFFRF